MPNEILDVTVEQQTLRDEVMTRIIESVRSNRRIALPDFDPALSRPSEHFALVTVGLEPNPYSGKVGRYRYQFEGEEDLLHLIVTREDESSISAQEGQTVAGFVLNGMPAGLIWLRPGEFSQHFYFGHDELLTHLKL